MPAPEALPPAVRAALSGHSRDPSKRGVSLGVKGHWLAAHQHFAAVSVQLSGRKAWLLAPPFYPAEVLHTARLTKVGDAAAGRLACGLARGERDVRVRGLTVCEVGPGEAIYVPGAGPLSQWWHGTCNLEDWTAGYSLFTRGLDVS